MIIKRIERLEDLVAPREEAECGQARDMLIAKLDAIADRRKADGWTPEPLSPEKLKGLIAELKESVKGLVNRRQ